MPSSPLRFYIDSGDSTFVNAASVIAAQWAAVGIQTEIRTMDINTLRVLQEAETLTLWRCSTPIRL